jgi:Putative zinc-finger/Anti-sigma-K factor rskA
VTCEEVRELLEAYALGTLEPDEHSQVETHLASCADCRGLVARYEEVLAGLPDALALASPLQLPETIKQRLLATIEAGDVAPAAESTSSVSRRSRVAAMRRSLVLVGAIALVLALASTAALSFALDRERQLKERFAGLLDQREIVLEVVDGRGTERAFLRSPDERSTAYGKLFTNPRLRDVVVMAGRLSKAREGERYRVLVTSGAITRSPGILKVNAKGFGLLVFDAGRAGPDYDGIRIRRERADAHPGSGETVLSWTRER